MVDLSYMNRDRVINDLANARLNKEGYGSQYLAAKYGDQGLSNILNEFGINQTEILDAADRIKSGEVSPTSGTQLSPAATTTTQAPPSKELVSQLDDAFSKQTGTGLPSVNIPLPTEKLASQLDNVFSKQTGIGLPSLGINLAGTGESLRPGNESGILSIGTPGTEFNELGSGSELGSGLDLGSGFGPATFNLQEAIREQARAAEDAEASGAPSLAEQQQVRNTFLDALQSQEGQGGGALGTAANVASSGITVADKLGVPIHPLGQVFTLLNTGRNFANQREADKLMNNPNLLGTFLRSVGLGGFLGVDPTVQRGGGLPFHPTPRQSEILSTDPVTLPPKIVDVTRETLPPPPITDMSPERKAQMWNQIQRFQQRPTVTPPEAGDIYDAPSYNPQSASFVDWAE